MTVNRQVSDDRPAVLIEVSGGVAAYASEGDVETWMQAGSLRAFFDGVLASDEYSQRAIARPVFVRHVFTVQQRFASAWPSQPRPRTRCAKHCAR